MAKRFTATDKWHDGWFLQLSSSNKLVWCYLLDTCTNGGRWVKNFKMLNFCCDTKMTESDFKKTFNGRMVDFEDFFFMPKFLRFQYPKGLNSSKPAIIGVRNELIQYGLVQIVKESLGNDYLIVMDKDKDKDKDNSKEGIIKGGKNIPPSLQEVMDYCAERKNNIDAQAFINHYAANNWFRGKTKIRDWHACIRTWEDGKREKSKYQYTQAQLYTIASAKKLAKGVDDEKGNLITDVPGFDSNVPTKTN